MQRYTICFILLPLLFPACKKEDIKEDILKTSVETLFINGKFVENGGKINNLLISKPLVVDIEFSTPVYVAGFDTEKIYISNISPVNFEITRGENDKHVVININNKAFRTYSSYQLNIVSGENMGVDLVANFTCTLETGIDSTLKFPLIPDDELLTLVQRQTFNYFWDFGHSVSGMARERSSSGDIVTTGGTGFGIMAMLVAVERGFITRAQAMERIQTIVTFLDDQATDYHGVYAHWINGKTGATQAFSAYDNGGDLVETAFLFQGLLVAREYFNAADAAEIRLSSDITRLWEAIEWDWYQKEGEKTLYWHWSPNFEWQMNMKISGWNEALIVYLLAASSPTHPIRKEVYEQGWTQNGRIKNGKHFYGYVLPLGQDYGGPLFFAHYSFLGLNPIHLKDPYADYWEQNRNHALINYNYCLSNPKHYTGYSPDCWGLTASDGNGGYNAFSPTNDKGVIAPTAAISSMPYTPEESMKALKFFYYILGDRLWKEYGFSDSFNPSTCWIDNEYLAIDQGPIIVMIENYRSQLIWNLFMKNNEIKSGLTQLGFTY